VFCEIIAGERPSSVVYEDALCTAFMDIHPSNPGHLLVVPKAHAPHLADLDPDTGAHLFVVAQRLAQAVRDSGVRCEGINLSLADGAAAGQEVFHVHLHVIPRYRGDRSRTRSGPGFGRRPSRSELDTTAQEIRSAL
jgi:diadenosine tetraphosphate (Ap4A) HIT family hydrolase